MPHRPLSSLDRLILTVRSNDFCYRLTLFTRIMLAAGFIPTGTVKLLGQRFTTIPPTSAIGAFFEAMYQTGLFWRFIGAVQVVAGLLLLVPRVAHIGALMFLPVICCIAVLTVALDFGLTEVVTAAMLGAVLYLCLWDYDRFRGLLTSRPLEAQLGIPVLRLDRWERIAFGAWALALLTFFASTRSFLPASVGRLAIPLGVAAGAAVLLRFVYIRRRTVDLQVREP